MSFAYVLPGINQSAPNFKQLQLTLSNDPALKSYGFISAAANDSKSITVTYTNPLTDDIHINLLTWIVNIIFNGADVKGFNRINYYQIRSADAKFDPSKNHDINGLFVKGSIWINNVSNKVFICTDNTSKNAKWTKLG